MSEVKALSPIGKTQWSKWNDEQRTTFNEVRAAGVSFPDAVKAVNDMKPQKKGNIITDIFHAVEDVVETATQVEAIVDVAAPLVKTVVKRTRTKKGK